MIKEFVDLFMAKTPELEQCFREKHPEDYKAIVTAVVAALHTEEFDSIDPNRIHEIDDGDYQGTLLYVIAGSNYQPNNYWFVRVGYGSCSGCDAMQAINDSWDDTPPTNEQVADYMVLALHVVQGLREMDN